MNDIYDKLGLILETFSLMILLKDYNNTDLMQELQNQDNYYFKKIIEQNNEILNLIKKGSDDSGK